jgi:type I restriction enzyme S subunit
MKLPTYPRTKPSGVEWLGDVPEHWEVKRGRFAMRVNPPAPRLRALKPEDEVSFVPMDAVGIGGGLNLEQTRILAEVSSGYTEFQDGDVVVAKITPCFENGKAALASGLLNGAAYGTTELHVLRAGPTLDRSFLFYVAISDTFRKLGESEMYGAGGQKRVPPEFNKNFRTPLPPLPEQRAIAAFLDRETGRVDRLVAKKRELIERLKEKRTALISRTVTRGLPPAAARAAGLPAHPPLKPSAFDWLGDIPKHWDIKPVKFVARIGNGSTPSRDNPSYWEEGDYPWLNSSVVNQETITEAEEFVTSLALRECHLPKIKPPAVLIGITGQGRTRGMASTLMFEATINQHVAYLKPFPSRAEVGFLRRVFDMVYLFLRSESDGGGSTKGAITCEQIANLKIPVPPLPEQAAIAAYLDEETAKLDALVGKVEAAVERLQEYRTALITAAVTGKIDVRKAVA